MTAPRLQPLRCLFVEDEENDALLALRELRAAGFDVTWERVDTGEAMRAALDRQPWDVILSDYQLPQFNGVAALQLLQDSGLDVPFIIVSGTIGEEVAVQAMKQGAHDYLMKGSLTRLASAVQRELRDAAERTQRKRAQAALEDSEERFRTLFAESPLGIAVVEARTGRVIEANARYHELLDQCENLHSERAWMGVVTPGDEAQQQELMAALDSGDNPRFQIHEQYRRRDGTDLWVQLTVARLSPDAEGRQRRVVMVEDVTQHVWADRLLRESEARFRRAVEEAPLPLMIHAETGEVLALSRSWTDITGYTQHDIPTLAAWADLAYGAEAPAVLTRIKDLYALTTRQAEGDFRVRCRDGSTRIWEFSSIALGSTADGRRLAMSMAADVTVDREQSEALRRHAEELTMLNEDLRRFNQTAVGRELRMVELKQEVNALCQRLGEPPRHRMSTLDETDAALGALGAAPAGASDV